MIYKSDCGRYICRALGDGHFEAWTLDGSTHWRYDNRCRTFADEGKLRPFAYCFGGFSNTKTGQRKNSFTLHLLHCNTRKKIKPFTGNTVIESTDVVFRRKIPAQNTPRWLRRASRP